MPFCIKSLDKATDSFGSPCACIKISRQHDKCSQFKWNEKVLFLLQSKKIPTQTLGTDPRVKHYCGTGNEPFLLPSQTSDQNRFAWSFNQSPVCSQEGRFVCRRKHRKHNSATCPQKVNHVSLSMLWHGFLWELRQNCDLTCNDRPTSTVIKYGNTWATGKRDINSSEIYFTGSALG